MSTFRPARRTQPDGNVDSATRTWESLLFTNSYFQVPGGQQKNELLELLDKVPAFVQQIQFTVKTPTVGKAATYTKVDVVIQQTKSLMYVISRVVTTCLVCATRYNLDFRGDGGGRGGLSGADENYGSSDYSSGFVDSLGGRGGGQGGQGLGGGGSADTNI